ncbi:MAG: GNAT family N-acetyltransferase [Lachnospiraceae bacterium]|nr:GNAT family N-acetyltransferase [Lachnospiraceae bacterium]
MENKFTICKNIRDNKHLRDSFNALAGETFGLNFEDWYQNGYWKDNYIPYSVLRDGEVVANVSVNPMEFIFDGKKINVIQLGTVMTKGTYRKQGLSRRLMEEITKDYADVDGIFLFANDGVLEFYPKFGFAASEETQYVREVEPAEGLTANADTALHLRGSADANAAVPVQEEDCTLFVKGKVFEDFAETKVMFPTLGHA